VADGHVLGPLGARVTGKPSVCAEVTFEMADEHYREPAWDANLGDLLWNPKAGNGHVLVAEVACNAWNSEHDEKYGIVDCGCGGWLSNPSHHTTLVCECGQDGSWRDHHYEILARAVE
jgi:hypothetical protein